MRVCPELVPMMDDGLRVRMFFDVDAPVVRAAGAGELDLAILTATRPPRHRDAAALLRVPRPRRLPRRGGARLGALHEGPAGARCSRRAGRRLRRGACRSCAVLADGVRAPASLRATLVANSLRASLQFALRAPA